ncbi:cobalamin biosynthesis protein CbiG [Marinomonas aquimarina]|uniref:Cobalamin biosynthesis protein CbiG n=1 Tax=Marinomonas aquimarina TaxID=295068 RepID=A0A1A8TB22_9GAMM|nr:cobalamin biosynthesis protein [Marinomonas aquimarina]SBS28758.1 cobalamin biosynthesis protein CbiG [Marinomonas aquimarina]
MIRIIALTDAGQVLGKRLQTLVPNSELHFKPKPFAETVQDFFREGDALLFICATGIVMRTLAPVIESKLQDPPVLVLDELGRFVIPLLSGHEGGANQWGSDVAKVLNAELVMTTANAYLNPVYTLGMGCERNCPLEYLESLMLEGLERVGLAPEQISGLYSIDIKADETHLIELAKKYQWPFMTYSAEALKAVEPLLSTRSDYVFNTVGVYGVAESAALLGAQRLTNASPELRLNKIKNPKATCAVARAYQI